MKKALLATFCIATLFVLITIMCPIKGNPVIEETTVSVQQEIVYAYVTTEMLTNNYGGVHGHQDYICNDIQDMLIEQFDVNWNNYPTTCKRGTACINKDGKWVLDTEMPILKGENRDYVNQYIFVGE